MAEHQQAQKSSESKSNTQTRAILPKHIPISHPAAIIQRARINPKSLTHADVMQLQRTIGNRAVGQLLSEIGLIPSKAKQTQPVQMQTIPEKKEKSLQGKFAAPLQRQEISEEEEPLQSKFEIGPEKEMCPSCIQRQEIPEEEEEPLQIKRENNTGMPDNLKAGVEKLSGIDMSDVRVHYNSYKPAELGALAYTQGTDIHVAPGQKRHLPHEAWHVVQQTQGRVRPTVQMKDVLINDDVELEREADDMGTKATQLFMSYSTIFDSLPFGNINQSTVLQQVTQFVDAKHFKGKFDTNFKKWTKEEYEEAKSWFIKAKKLTSSDVTMLMETFENFTDWWYNWYTISPENVSSQEVMNQAPPSQAPQQPVKVDPLTEVKQQLRSHRLEISDFTDEDLQTILVAKNQQGWTQAIANVNEERIRRIQSERLVKERIGKYSAVKLVGDTLFTGGLIKAVWDVSFALATAGGVGPNNTVPGAYSDQEINAAADMWHHKHEVQPQLGCQPGSLPVTNMHVPGAPNYIEDKSKRPINPDPSRGRQADFICNWGNVTINVHVDSTTKH